MQRKAEGGNVEKYIKEGLVVLLPRYQEGNGETVVYTTEDKYLDPREISWLVKKLAAYYNLNLSGLRRYCGRLLGLRHHISLPFSEGLVLLPLKLRQADGPGETTTGFVNMMQVMDVLPLPVQSVFEQPAMAHPGGRPPPGQPAKKKPAWLSRIRFKGGLELKTLNTLETLQNRLGQGEIVLEDLLRRQRQGVTFTGLTQQAFLKELPHCNCLLKDLILIPSLLKQVLNGDNPARGEK